MKKVEHRQTTALLLLLQRPDGVRCHELADVLEVSRASASACMAPLIKAGQVCALGGLATRIYCAPEFAPAIRVRLQESKIRKRRAAQRAAKQRKRKAESATRAKLPIDAMVQRSVPASQAKPLRGLGPASVFELGAKL